MTYSLILAAAAFPSPLPADKTMASLSSMYSVIYGNPNVFTPKWFGPISLDHFLPYKWNYLYDSKALKNTLEQFIDFNLINGKNKLETNRLNSSARQSQIQSQ